jgi:ornithine decarboxylase
VTELPARVHDAVGTRTEPALVFDLARIDATMAEVARIAHRHAIQVLFAAKAFPHPRVLELAAGSLDGIDLAGPEERALAAGAGARRVSITDPGLDPTTLPAGRITVTCESVEQVTAVRAARPDAAIALRLSMSAVMPGDDAVGALQAGDGHRRSRFGAEPGPDGAWAELRTMAAAAGGARLGLHVHSAGVVPTSPARWAAIAAAVVAIARTCERAPTFLDLGGGWHGVADQLDPALAAVREAAPGFELVIEPGRLFSRDAGHAVGRVLAARTLADRELRVMSLSRIAHLRWSPVELVAPAPRPGRGRKLTFAGATCFEDDVIGDWLVDDPAISPGSEGHGHLRNPMNVGTRVGWSGVTGYSVAWNRGFAGVPAAHVLFTK